MSSTPYTQYDNLLAARDAALHEETIPDDVVTGGRPITIFSTEYPQREATVAFFAELEQARPRNTMRSNLSQETHWYSLASGNLYEHSDTPTFPVDVSPYPSHPAPLMALISAPHQSFESGVLDPYPFILSDDNNSSDDDTHTLTESRDTSQTSYSPTVVSIAEVEVETHTLTESRDTSQISHAPAIVSTSNVTSPASPAPYHANYPSGQRDYILPAEDAYFSAQRVQSRQAILSFSSGANYRDAPRLILHPPLPEWVERVLVESVEDSEGTRLFEIISNPGYLLTQGRDLLCHGDLIGLWTIYMANKIVEHYIYLTLFSAELQKNAIVRIPFRYFHKDTNSWPSFFTVSPPS
jgi:hypothetical protein